MKIEILQMSWRWTEKTWDLWPSIILEFYDTYWAFTDRNEFMNHNEFTDHSEWMSFPANNITMQNNITYNYVEMFN